MASTWLRYSSLVEGHPAMVQGPGELGLRKNQLLLGDALHPVGAIK